MKTTPIPKERTIGSKWFGLLALAVTVGAHAAESAPAAQGMREAATHDSIVEIARKAKEEEAKQEKPPVFKPVPADQQPKQEPRSLVAVSDIICYNGYATMVPKRAVLHVPKKLADRLGMKDGARFVTFQEFLASNRAWLTNSEVSRVQAEGNQPLLEAVLKSFEKEPRMVVATFHEGPISVLPLKVPETPTAAAK